MKVIYQLKCRGYDLQLFEDRFKLVPSGFFKSGVSEVTIPLNSVTSIGWRKANWGEGALNWSVAGKRDAVFFRKDNETAEKIVAFIEQRISKRD